MKPSYIEEIRSFVPHDAQEAGDQEVILWYIERFGDTILTRENPIAHLTSSGFIMNPQRTKALMIHHNIRNTWAWTGGHLDGDSDMLAVAMREAMEETGVSHIRPLSHKIASIDILPVFGHVRRGQYVSAHLHLSIAYILICEESEMLQIKPDENSGVRWFGVNEIAMPAFSADDVHLYGKFIRWETER